MLGAQVLIIGFGIRGTPLGKPGTRRTQLQLEGIDHGGRDFILYFENAANVSLISLRPNLVTGISANQLHADTNGITRFAYTALENVRDSQLATDVFDGCRAV